MLAGASIVLIMLVLSYQELREGLVRNLDGFSRFASTVSQSGFTFARILILSLLGASAGWSQITTGTLTGTVTDPAGAVVLDGRVQVISQSTASVAELHTNQAGLYKAAFLIPGKYTVRVQVTGFRTFEAKDVEVQLSRETVMNAVLEVRAVGETVEVHGPAPVIDSHTSPLNFNVVCHKVLSLPST